MSIAAKYEDGVFKPLEDVQIKEGTLVEVYLPSEHKPASRRPSLPELSFFGMWKDREDIVNGVDYVNKLRGNPTSLTPTR